MEQILSSVFYALFCLLFTKPREVARITSYFTNEETEAQRFGYASEFTKLVISKAGIQMQC